MTIPKLHTVLYANALFSCSSAVLMLLFPGLLAVYVINLPVSVFRLLGGALLLFALDVFLTARKIAPSRGKVIYIFAADLAWVILTPVAMVVLSERLARVGNLLLVDIALVVATFATFEWLALKRSDDSRPAGIFQTRS